MAAHCRGIPGAAIAAAPAAADTWSGVYGATIVATYADGHTVKVFTNADHTFKIQPAAAAAADLLAAQGIQGGRHPLTAKTPPAPSTR